MQITGTNGQVVPVKAGGATPELQTALEDFYVSLVHPGAFVWEEQSSAWRAAQRFLCERHFKQKNAREQSILNRLSEIAAQQRRNSF
jgi:predicted RNA-binding protein YlxR (DUF448 family)